MKAVGTVRTNPQVNLLANLIRWVSVAKREVGVEQLPTFLDTYAISEALSAELRQGVLQLAEVVAEQPGTADSDMANAWSRLILELHGIISGGGMPSSVQEPSLDLSDESESSPCGIEPECEDPDAEPVEAKLALPTDDDLTERDFTIAL
jgi:hypothetical protein